MSFSFTFSSLYEEIQSFLIKTSVLFGCVFRVKSVLTLFVQEVQVVLELNLV